MTEIAGLNAVNCLFPKVLDSLDDDPQARELAHGSTPNRCNRGEII